LAEVGDGFVIAVEDAGEWAIVDRSDDMRFRWIPGFQINVRCEPEVSAPVVRPGDERVQMVGG